MIAVIIPAHNEEQLIGHCLSSVWRASDHPDLCGESVIVVVALDRCTDATGAIAQSHGALCVSLTDGNVGMARAAAANLALDCGARWLATTDADSCVPENWIAAQLGAGADAFCGVVEVDDWSDYPPGMAARFSGSESVADGHPHIHGANMGVSADFYRRCGGFQALTVSEDVALVQALMCTDARIARLASPVVRTSARKVARATGGFSDYLKNMEQELSLCAV